MNILIIIHFSVEFVNINNYKPTQVQFLYLWKHFFELRYKKGKLIWFNILHVYFKRSTLLLMQLQDTTTLTLIIIQYADFTLHKILKNGNNVMVIYFCIYEQNIIKLILKY